jgi:hypothetical protein
MGWKSLTGCLPMHTSDHSGLRICMGQASESLVCCDVIAYLTASANIDLASGPFAANI